MSQVQGMLAKCTSTRGDKGDRAIPIDPPEKHQSTNSTCHQLNYKRSSMSECRTTHQNYCTWTPGSLFFQILELRILWFQCSPASSKAPTALRELPRTGCLWPETRWVNVKKKQYANWWFFKSYKDSTEHFQSTKPHPKALPSSQEKKKKKTLQMYHNKCISHLEHKF